MKLIHLKVKQKVNTQARVVANGMLFKAFPMCKVIGLIEIKDDSAFVLLLLLKG